MKLKTSTEMHYEITWAISGVRAFQNWLKKREDIAKAKAYNKGYTAGSHNGYNAGYNRGFDVAKNGDNR